MYEYEDFYHETSEFEQQVDEFKQALLKSVKEEYKAEMEQLRKENAELQEVKNNFDQIKRESESKIRELDIEKNNLRRTVRNERLTELMKDFHVIAYRARSKNEELPKCDKCNEIRRIEFLSPTGKQMTEECECSKGRKIYVPDEVEVAEFTIDRHGTGMSMWYCRKYADSDHYHSTDYAEHIYKTGTNYEELGSHWGVFFRDKEECQKYCDWLTEKESKED
jgi:hypothetical protein